MYPNLYAPIGTLISGQRPRASADVLEPSSRWWRVRQAMRRHIERNVSMYVASGLTDQLYNLPGIWTEDQYTARMDEIRDMGIEAYEADHICHEGMNRFFDAFGIDVHDPTCGEFDYECGDCETCNPQTTKTVTVTVEITLTITNDADADDTESDVERYLSIELGTGSIDDVESENWEITSTSVDVDESY